MSFVKMYEYDNCLERSGARILPKVCNRSETRILPKVCKYKASHCAILRNGELLESCQFT